MIQVLSREEKKMRSKIIILSTSIVLAGLALTAHGAPSVTVYGTVSSAESTIDVDLYGDISDCSLLSYGVTLTYDPVDLTVQSATKNEDVWYFGDGTTNFLYIDPETDDPGSVVIIGGKIDTYDPAAGVEGSGVFLGRVSFTKNTSNVPSLTLSLGRDGEYKNFVTTDSIILDDQVDGVIFSQITIPTQPVADIKVNGSDTPISITTADTLSFAVELQAGDQVGNNADWWWLASTPWGWYHYQFDSNSWARGLTVSDQGAASDFSATDSLSGLPAGSYTFYFGVDMIMNGAVDLGDIYYDSAEVNVSP